MTKQDQWDARDWDDTWEAEPNTAAQYLRNIIIVVVLGGLLFLSGIYQGTLFHRTPVVEQEALPAAAVYPEITVPLRIIVFTSTGKNSSDRSVENVEQLVANASSLWNQASISLSIEEIIFTETNEQEVQFFVEYPAPLLESFADPSLEGITVFLMKALSGLNGIAFSGARTVAVADFTTVRDFRTLAHEIGHILGLSHTTDTSDLMFSGSNGTDLSDQEIMRARGTIEE